MFLQSEAEQVETMIHEIGHIFGLRHFFANVSETAYRSEIFGTHNPFSIMNYGYQSKLTDDDRDDLRRLYQQARSGALTAINGTPIRFVRPYHMLAQRGMRTAFERAAARGTSGREGLLMSTSPTSAFVAQTEATVPVKVAVSIGAGGRLSANLNESRLTFSGGVAHAAVPAGRTNTLSWVAVGAPGTPWSVSVPVPSGSGCASTGAIDDSRQATGFCEFAS
jgi:hypothetical protein